MLVALQIACRGAGKVRHSLPQEHYSANARIHQITAITLICWHFGDVAQIFGIPTVGTLDATGTLL